MRVEPWPGESLQSWVEQLARRYNVKVAQMGAHLGLPALPPDQWSLGLTKDQIDQVSVVAGVNPAGVETMTLAPWMERWAGPGGGGMHPDAPSKHCGRCLIDNGGRWLLSWRLPMQQVCQRHQVLLRRGCGYCGRPIRGLKGDSSQAPGCLYRCRRWLSAQHVVVPHGSVEAAGASFLHGITEATAGDRVRTASGAVLTPSRLYREARLLQERIKSVLHPHDLLDARRSGRWAPQRVCGLGYLGVHDDPTGLYGWALAAQVLLADDQQEAVDAVRWVIARERRNSRFPRSKYEHLRMPESVGPALKPILADAIEQVDEPCPETLCEPTVRLHRVMGKVEHRLGGDGLEVTYENLDQVLWDHALRGWTAALARAVSRT